MYPTELTEEPGIMLKPVVVKARRSVRTKGRPPPPDCRAELNGMRSVLKTGCQGRLLPQDFPPWKTGAGSRRRWRLDGSWQRAMQAWREAARQKVGRQPEPAVAIREARAVKSAATGGSAVSRRARRPQAASRTAR